MGLLIDMPRWPAHERLWAHLVSDSSLEELHEFAERVGIPRRSFEGDHYDVPAERHGAVVAAGARLVTGRELVKALQRSGLRLPKRKGERVLCTWDDPVWPAGAGPHRVDCIASSLNPPTSEATWLVALDDESRLAVVTSQHTGADQLTGAGPTPGYHLPEPGHLQPAALAPLPLGYLRVRSAVAGDRIAWRHIAVVRHRGPLAGVRWVPLALVRDVEAQLHWWPLLGLALRPEA